MALATAGDIVGRLGRALTAAETTQVAALLDDAAGLIAEAVDKTQSWIDDLTTVPPALRLICIEAIVRVLLNPTGASSVQETLGAYSHAERYDRPGQVAGGLALTEAEERRARRAVYGQNTAAAQIGSILRSP